MNPPTPGHTLQNKARYRIVDGQRAHSNVRNGEPSRGFGPSDVSKLKLRQELISMQQDFTTGEVRGAISTIRKASNKPT